MRQTRLQKAKELNRLLKQGPHLSLSVFGVAGERALTKEQEAAIHDRIISWISTWVEPICADLIKEYDERAS